MAGIRDWTWNYSSAASTSSSPFLPGGLVAGDILLAVLTTSSANGVAFVTPTYTPPTTGTANSWTQLFTRTSNTATASAINLQVYWYRVTGTETGNTWYGPWTISTSVYSAVHLIAVKDAPASGNPFAAGTGTGSTFGTGYSVSDIVPNTFSANIGGNGLQANAVPIGGQTLQVFASNGANIRPGMTISNGTVLIGTITSQLPLSGIVTTYTQGGSGFYRITPALTAITANMLPITNSTNLLGVGNVLTLSSAVTVGSATLGVGQRINGPGILPGTSIAALDPLVGSTTVNSAGYTYILNVPQTLSTTIGLTAGPSRGTFTSYTPTNNNNLLVYILADNSANPTVPMVQEGPVIYEDGADAIVHSEGWGWGYQRYGGIASSSSVYYNRFNGNYAVAATLCLSSSDNTNPVYIPTYCATDNSSLVDVISGNVAYQSNVGLSGNAQSYFSAGISGGTGSLALSSVTVAGAAGQFSFTSVSPTTIVSGQTVLVSGSPTTTIAGTISLSTTATNTFTLGTATTLFVGEQIAISGTFSTGSLTGYVSGTTYYIIATNGTTTFTVSTSLGGAATAATASTGAITGITITVIPITGYVAPLGNAYVISATNGSSTFTLTNPGGAALATVNGSATSGLTFTYTAPYWGGNTVSTAIQVSSTTDVGINSYHSLGTISTPVTPTVGTWYGAVLQPNYPFGINVGTKNILVHTRPSTPKILQTTPSIVAPTTKGLAIGLSSSMSNTAMKVYHVHGASTLWNSSTYVPLVVNSGYTGNGVLQTTGSLTTSTILNVGLFTSGFNLATTWQFGSLWTLDTTVVCGGNAANPVNIAGLLKAAATGKERLSILEQGVSQALILQPIQFGQGATGAAGGGEPIYLNLDSSVIEFPKQYDIASSQVYYCSTDNIAGLTYYAGPSDTIIHTNGVISSQSKFFWGFNAATSISASYQFDGTILTGAGQVTLNANVNINQFTFNQCVEAAQASFTASLTTSSISGTTLTVGAVASGVIQIGMVLVGTGIAQGTTIISGSALSWQVSQSQTVSSTTITAILKNTLSNSFFSKTTAGSTQGAYLISGATQNEIQYGLDKLTNTNFANCTASSGALHLQYTGAASTITANTSSLTFSTNTKDIYWDAPAGSTLNLNLTGTANPTTSLATNSNTVNLRKIRTLSISGIVDSSNVSIYAQSSPTVAIAGPTTVGSATVGTLVNSLAITADSVNSGRYVATYTYIYTTDTPVNVVVLNVGSGGTGGYQALRPTSSLTNAGAAITVNQITDRQYSNPT